MTIEDAALRFLIAGPRRGSSPARSAPAMSTDARPRHLLLCAGLLLAGGCSSTAPIPPDDGVLSGHLSMGPEGELFLPCGRERALRLQATPELVERLQLQYLTLVDEPYEEAFLQLRGSPMADAVWMAQILDFRPAADEDCRPVPPATSNR